MPYVDSVVIKKEPACISRQKKLATRDSTPIKQLFFEQLEFAAPRSLIIHQGAEEEAEVAE